MQNTLLWVGAGDIAQRCAAYLPCDTWHRIALKRHEPAHPGFNHVFNADVTQPNQLAALPSASHVVYSVTPNGRTAEAYQAVYEQGLKNLINAIDQTALQRFIFISSTSVYGPDPVPQNEFSLLKPTTFSGQAIQAAERYLTEQLGDKLVILRFSGLYGPGRTMVFERLTNQTMRINPAMDNYANRIHVDDAARACAHLLQHPNPELCYVATDSTPLPLRQLYLHSSARLGVPAPVLDAQIPYESKHFCNQRLLLSGFTFTYPQTLAGYDAVIDDYLAHWHVG
ncbi:hypothetical protein PAEH1_11245 [Paenalcaligenes hominis]|uniref:NAD-dependent epimerase/dehydratase domain-containing protein n=2 Tax=Paenalcaligenes hominis TaxID=643674 RepID=A0A1U9K1X2_9BURK|nr:NAD-dependent epimerase/dehydratase family protein [Paenalcaligenes hominis]AQS51974.1 hypothetical protein PAEH1_11245 [Paenalcaligenes hominis]